jgi:phospholipid-binding lipoprotein MlaA
VGWIVKSNKKMIAARLLLLVLLALPLANCATAPEGDAEAMLRYEEANDPMEPWNRGVLEFNRGFDDFVLRPIAVVYRHILPDVVRERIHLFLMNLRTPVILANDLMQGEPERAGETLGRFVINSTVGVGGLFDVATEWGLEPHNEDFGQTLAVWGAGEGPYLMLPFFGPSNPRDATGIVVDIFLDPLNYLLDDKYLIARTGTRIVDERERNIENLDNLEATSIDFYAALRSLYRQYRDNEVRNGSLPPPLPIPGISIERYHDDDAPPVTEELEPDDSVPTQDTASAS